jgi:NAD(P)-dependent dehydrogenase (short-subunit alcohol dehydrogenase family)
VYLVSGGAGGIGAAIGRHLAQAGAHVVVAGRDEARAAATAAQLGGSAVALDARDPDQTEARVGEVLARLGRLDGIANCAGSILIKPAHQTRTAELSETIAQNLITAFSAVRAAGRHMTQGGAVLLFSTAAARLGLPNHEAIAAAKAGVEGLVRSAAATYAPRKLRVNAIAPGLVRTPLSARLTESKPSLDASTALHALGRIGEPEDIAPLAAFLLSPESGWITGQVFGADGGLSTVRTRQGG